MRLTIVTFLLALGLSARLTRLLVRDLIAEPLRTKVAEAIYAGRTWELNEARTSGEYSKASLKNRIAKFASDLLACDWCASVWTSAFAFGWAAAAVHGGGSCLTSFTWVSAAASASFLVGVSSVILDRVQGD